MSEQIPQLDIGVENLRVIEGTRARPTDSRKKYISITRELQARLGIENPTDYMVAIYDAETGMTDLYILSALLPDQDWGDGKPGFLSRADRGEYRANGIENRDDAEAVVRANPITENSLGTPDFRQNNVGKNLEMGIFKPEDVQEGTSIKTKLPVVADGRYPENLVRKWSAANTKGLPIIVVPNAVAKLAGLETTYATNNSVGPTVVDGGECTVVLPDGRKIQAFIGGALDSVGISSEIIAGGEIVVEIHAGQRKLSFLQPTV